MFILWSVLSEVCGRTVLYLVNGTPLVQYSMYSIPWYTYHNNNKRRSEFQSSLLHRRSQFSGHSVICLSLLRDLYLSFFLNDWIESFPVREFIKSCQLSLGFIFCRPPLCGTTISLETGGWPSTTSEIYDGSYG